MKKYGKVFMLLALFGITNQNSIAQGKKVVKKTSAKITPVKKLTTVKFEPVEFGSPASISDITDIKETNPAYQSLQNLVEKNGVKIVYADSTFRPKELLRRGDFIVSFNSALDAIKKAGDAGGTAWQNISNYDKNKADITQVSEIKDVKEASFYYPAVQSLIEQYGITAPFTKTRLLNAGATMQEGEVYQILKETLGYNSSGLNPYATAMTRAKFAMVLNNALNLKLTQVNAMISAGKDSLDDVANQQAVLLKQQDKQKRDSMVKGAELSRIEALRKEAETWSKLSDSEKRKQLKKQNSK